MSRADDDLLDDIPDPFAEQLSRPLPPAPAVSAAASPTRASVSRLRWIAALLAVAYQLCALSVMGLRADIQVVPRAALALLVVSPLVAAGVALRAALRERAGAPAPVPTSTWVAAAMAVFVLGAVAAEASSHAAHGASVWPCVAGTLMLTAGPLALGAFALRRAFASGAPWRMGAIGVACGALSASALALECGAGGVGHVVVGHGAGMVAGGLAGLALSRSSRA